MNCLLLLLSQQCEEVIESGVQYPSPLPFLHSLPLCSPPLCLPSLPSRGLSSHPVGVEFSPPETNLLPPGEGPSTPPSGGSTCFTALGPLHVKLIVFCSFSRTCFVLCVHRPVTSSYCEQNVVQTKQTRSFNT